MPPSVWPNAVATAGLPEAPEPTPPLKVLPAPLAQPPALVRYRWKLSVVPDWSDRYTTLIFVSGSVAFGFSFLIAGSFQFLISPSKIFAVAAASRARSETPLTL